MKKTLLYIDDDPDDIEVFCDAVRATQTSINFMSADSGKSGISMIAEQCPEIIFLDYNMPQMDGLEVLKKIKATPCGANAKVIMYSTFMMESHISKCLSNGAFAYRQKPNSFSLLKDIVRDLCEA